MASDDACQLIRSSLITEVARLKSDRGQSELSVQEVNVALPSLHPRLKEYFQNHMPTASDRDREAVRKKIYFEAGISDGRPETFYGMTLLEVIKYMEENNIDTIGALPSKLNEWISSHRGWKDEILKVLPMKAYYISVGGHACRSKYELIIANMLEELLPPGASLSCAQPYPYHPEFNNAIPLTCDFIVQAEERAIWMELFLFRPDSQFQVGTGIGAARPSYLERRQRKVNLFNAQKPGCQLVSIETSTITGKSKSYRQFIKDVLFELNPILHLERVDIDNQPLFTALVARFCTEYSPMSIKNRTLIDTLLQKASESFQISTNKLEMIHDLMVTGLNAKTALTDQSLPVNTFLGLSRLTGDASWQLRRTVPTVMNGHFSDGKLGKGSSLLSYANAINHLALVKLGNSANTETHPKWVQHYLERNSEIGQLAI